MEWIGIDSYSSRNFTIMLEAINISKRFSGVMALSNVHLQLLPGKVNAIIGENGAGKSTLMKIFSGVYTQYEGDILLNGNLVKFTGTKDAEAHGIAIIHQELNLVPYLSIADNIFLGKELVNAFGVLDRMQMNLITTQLLKRLYLNLDPDTKIKDIKVGHQQLIEIAKALYSQASVIIMDEPTSAISDKEVTNLFEIITELKQEGKTIAYISHKFNELFSIADTYVVLRDGVSVAQGQMSQTTEAFLIQQMTGRNLESQKRNSDPNLSETLFEVKGLGLKNLDKQSKYVFKDLSFSLKKGEILGIYGLMGAGRTEVLETIFGLHPKNAIGEVWVNQQLKNIQSASDAIAARLALVPEDRKLQGLILDQTVASNISIIVLKLLEKWGLLLLKNKEQSLVQEYAEKLGIKSGSNRNIVKHLSGGNQQKIVIAKWLATHPLVLLLDEPTRGIDVNAKSEIYKLVKELATQGMGVIMVSSELPEILSLSDRVLVISEGRITANLPIELATEQAVLTFAILQNN